MVLGAVFFKGTETGSSFGIIFLVFAWSDETRKNQMSQKWAPTIPKDAARLGDLGKRVFGPKFPKYVGKNLDLGFAGFLDFPDFLVFSLRLGPPAKEI